MKLAFVIPWYGPDIPGGAEAETRRTAEQLAAAGLEVEVLTTCIRDLYADWSHNHHRPGVSRLNGVTVRRFPVADRDRTAFDEVNWRLMNNLALTPAQEAIYVNEQFRVPALYDFIRQNCRDYLFFFIPYLFATTYHGLTICPERSVLIPCFHDEMYARLAIFKPMVAAARALILHADAERALAARLFGPAGDQPRLVLGEGVDTDFSADATRFRQKYGLDGPFVLYAGRREAGKNVPLLLDYWRRYTQSSTFRGQKLVLLGSGAVDIPPAARAHIVDLGFVPGQDKYDAYAAAAIFCQPSLNESFSIVLMESWLAGTPALVHAGCAVTREHCVKANGGLYFSNFPEFAATLDYLFDRPDRARQLGRLGRDYVLANYRWEIIVDRYRALINDLSEEVLATD